MSKRQAKSTFHALYTVLHDLTVKQGFVTTTGEVSLPFNWDKNTDFVDLTYKLQDKELKIKCLLMSDSFVINALYGNSVKTLELKIEHYISNFSDADNTYDVLNQENFERKYYDNVMFELFSELKPKKLSDEARRAREEVSQPSRLLVDDRYTSRPRYDPYSDPFAVGGGDLDPFGGGPGMVMDPFRAGNGRGPMYGGFPGRDPFRGGRVRAPPPGARFDPVGPGGFGPDNDELMPPGLPRRDDFYS